MPKIASGVSTERSLFSVHSGNHLPPFPHSYKHSPSIVNPTHTRCAAVSQGRDGCSLLRGAFENDLIAAHGTSLCVVHRFAWNTLSVTITCRGKPGSTLLGPEATLNTHTHTLTHTHIRTRPLSSYWEMSNCRVTMICCAPGGKKGGEKGQGTRLHNKGTERK